MSLSIKTLWSQETVLVVVDLPDGGPLIKGKKKYFRFLTFFCLKGTVNVTFLAKIAISDSQRYPLKLRLINNLEDIVMFLGLKVFNCNNSFMFPCSRNAKVKFVENPKLKMICLKNNKQSMFEFKSWSNSNILITASIE